MEIYENIYFSINVLFTMSVSVEIKFINNFFNLFKVDRNK